MIFSNKINDLSRQLNTVNDDINQLKIQLQSTCKHYDVRIYQDEKKILEEYYLSNKYSTFYKQCYTCNKLFLRDKF